MQNVSLGDSIKCCILFSGKNNKRKYLNLSAEILPSMQNIHFSYGGHCEKLNNLSGQFPHS